MARLTTVGLLVACLGGALLVAFACVPADNRPPPGSLTITVSPSPAVRDGVLTADGWRVTFDRVVVSMGRTSLGNDCASYASASYDRVLDVTSRSDQKLSVLHGLGSCDLRFRVSSPSSDAVLGEGVSETDRTALRAPGGDAHVPSGGVALAVRATATRGAVTKRFTWLFRSRVRYGGCSLTPDSGPAVDLRAEVDQVVDIRIEAEAVLRDDVDASTAALRFEPFAAADADGDGDVTLEELGQVPLAAVRDAGAFEAGTYDFDEDAGLFRAGRPIVIETLGDYVYEILMPTFPRWGGTGACTISAGGRGGGPG
jgi:hypothetical protein